MIKEVEINNPLKKEIQPDNSFVMVTDAYRGCQLKCPYCFQMNYSDWCSNIEVRKNIITALESELQKKHDFTDIYIGSDSDPYMPLEEEYKLTREILKVFCNKEYNIYIVSKSNNKLILRDMDIMKKFKKPIKIIFVLSCIEEANKGKNHVNISVANELKRNGINVDVHITPILPYVMNLDEMIEAIDKDIHICLDKLRIFTKGGQDKKIYNWIQSNYPMYTDEYYKIVFENDESYYKDILKKYKGNSRIEFLSKTWGV